jgi:hypothetical protein
MSKWDTKKTDNRQIKPSKFGVKVKVKVKKSHYRPRQVHRFTGG